MDLREGAAVQDRAVRDPYLDDLHLSLGKSLDLNSGREPEHSRRLSRRRVLRVYGEGQAQFFFDKIDLAVINGISYSRNGIASTCLLSDEAAQQVQFVGIRRRH